MKIVVTQDDIDKGRKYNPIACPVALALRRTFPDKDIRSAYTVAVEHIQLNHFNTVKSYPYPKGVSLSIQDFDRGLEIAPFEFELEI